MATSYTSLLGFALPVTGELQGTWGDTVNNSITQLCEDSIAGVATASVLSSDWTLTTTGAGAANQARMAILIPTGSPGVSRNIIAPSKSKTYTVINQSNAAVVIKGAATTGVSVASGDTVIVAWNGSDFVVVKNAAGTFTNLTYTGTLTGSTGVMNIGSGQLYKDASGNVGIGTSFPTTKLAVVGSISAMSGGKLVLWDSSNSYTPYIQSPAADVISFFSNSGTERMRIDSSGNVGIGTSSPVSNSLSITQYKNLSWVWSSGSNYANIFNQASSAALILASGYKLSSTANGFASSFAGSWSKSAIAVDDGSIRFFVDAATTVPVGTDITPTERMRIDSSGNVGIGTSSPTYKLSVSNAGGVGFEVDPVTGTNSGVNLISYNRLTSSYKSLSINAFDIRLYGGGSNESMRIDSSGNLLVGATSTLYTGTRLSARTSSNTLAAAEFWSNSSGDVAQTMVYISKYDNNSTSSQVFARFTINAGAVGSGQINANGASSVAFGAWSDARLKENIVDLPSQLNNILALRPVEFDYIESEGGGHQIGFIAQEMQEVYPDVIGEREDGMLTVTGWSKTESRLVKAIQEQQTLIESLTARIATLEAK